MKKVLLFVLCAMCAVMFSACSTVKGLGDDIQTVGHWFVKGSDKVQNAQK